MSVAEYESFLKRDNTQLHSAKWFYLILSKCDVHVSFWKWRYTLKLKLEVHEYHKLM